MKKVKFAILSVFTLFISCSSFAHHRLYPHQHEQAANQHSLFPGGILLALLVVVGIVIFTKKYKQFREEKNK
jgi:membrane protein YdbS with pleckstrin-like domain